MTNKLTFTLKFWQLALLIAGIFAVVGYACIYGFVLGAARCY